MRIETPNYPGEANPTPALIVDDRLGLSDDHVENVGNAKEFSRAAGMSLAPRRPEHESFALCLPLTTPGDESFIQNAVSGKSAVNIYGNHIASFKGLSLSDRSHLRRPYHVVWALFLLALLTAISPSSSTAQKKEGAKPPRPEVAKAIEALKLVRTASKFSENYDDYRNRVIDAKAAVEGAQEVLEDRFPDLKLKLQLTETIHDYMYGKSAWHLMQTDGWMDIDKDEIFAGPMLKSFPSIPIHESRGKRVVYRSQVLEIMWKSASDNLDKAAQLAKEQ